MSPWRSKPFFSKFAWSVLGYNLIVILWGVFLRASRSGDGCGRFWLTCHGEVIPSAPELKTIIEFTHRVTSGIAFVLVLLLVIWAFRKFQARHPVRRAAVLAFIFVLSEALVGAGLVLTGNTAEAVTSARPFWAAGHLLNTFILLAALTLTAWYSENVYHRPAVDRRSVGLLAAAAAGLLLVGVSGSVAALSNMLFPSASLAEGLAKDLSPASDALLRLRFLHPLLSIFTGVYIIFLAGWLKKRSSGFAGSPKYLSWLSALLMIQLAFGAATLLMLGPIVMQVGHLLLADAIWIVFVLASVSQVHGPAYTDGAADASAGPMPPMSRLHETEGA
jgi:heme A synthase